MENALLPVDVGRAKRLCLSSVTPVNQGTCKGVYPPPTIREGWPSRVTACLLQLTPSESYLGLLTPVTFLVLIKTAAIH